MLSYFLFVGFLLLVALPSLCCHLFRFLCDRDSRGAPNRQRPVNGGMEAGHEPLTVIYVSPENAEMEVDLDDDPLLQTIGGAGEYAPLPGGGPPSYHESMCVSNAPPKYEDVMDGRGVTSIRSAVVDDAEAVRILSEARALYQALGRAGLLDIGEDEDF